MNRLVRLVALAAVLFPFLARAQGAQLGAAFPGDVYVAPRLGMWEPNNSDLRDFNTGFGMEVAIGKRFTPNLAAEVGIGWFRSQTDTMLFSDPTLGTYSGDAEFSALPVTALGKLILPLRNLDLFVAGGFGVVFTDLKATASTMYGSGSQTYSDTSLAAVMGLGASMRLTPRMNMDVMWRYMLGSADVSTEKVTYDSSLFTGGLSFAF